MKKSILCLATSAFIAGEIFTSCNTPAQKVENAQNNVTEANLDLNKANEEYLEDIEKYRKETADKIAANNLSISDFNARIENEKKEAKTDYKKKLAVLENKNNDIKKRMEDYQAEGKEKWELFKAEFNHDMNELGLALKDLGVKNVR